MISYPLQKSTYLVLAIFNRIVFSLELFQTYQNWQVRHLYPLRCGCYPYLLTYVLTYLLDWHSNPEFVMLQIASLEEALTVIEGMRAKYYCRGQQIIAYRKKVRQQVGPDSRSCPSNEDRDSLFKHGCCWLLSTLRLQKEPRL